MRAQNEQEIKSIKIKKEQLFVKAVFDDTEFKVVAIDRYGNPHQEAIKSFVIFYKDGNAGYEAKITGNVFPQKTIDFFTKKKKEATKIYLQKIVAENKEGHLEELPDLYDIVIFPDCKSVKKK